MAEVESTRKKKHDEALAVLALLGVSLLGYAESLLPDLASGRTQPFTFGNLLLSQLGLAHAHANYLGRYSVGSLTPFGTQDSTVGDIMVADQAPYMAGFVLDIEHGEYGSGDELDDEGLLARIGLYLERLRGTANDAVVNTVSSLKDETVDWKLDPFILTQHCADCVEMAAQNPWVLSELTRVPGDGSTICGVNCHCELVHNGEIISF